MSVTAQPSLLDHVSPLPSAPRQCCVLCGQRLPKVFAQHLTKGLVSALWKLYQAGSGPIQISKIGLVAGAEFNNFQKLRYFGLAIQHGRGKWQLTFDGMDFLRGHLSVAKTVFTKAGRVVDRSAERVFVTDVIPGWQWREDWAAEARVA